MTPSPPGLNLGNGKPPIASNTLVINPGLPPPTTSGLGVASSRSSEVLQVSMNSEKNDIVPKSDTGDLQTQEKDNDASPPIQPDQEAGTPASQGEERPNVSNKEKARQREEDMMNFCISVAEDNNADEESSLRAKQFLESKKAKDKVNKDLADLYQKMEALKLEQVEANKKVKDQAKLISAEKRSKELGFSRIKTPISEEEVSHLCRENYLTVAEEEDNSPVHNVTPAEWITKHLGKEARRSDRLMAKIKTESNPDKKAELILTEFLFAFSAHFSEVKEWIRKLNVSINEVIHHHNKAVDTKLVEFQRPSYARMAAASAAPIDQKKVVKIATKEFEKQFQARQLQESKHVQEREKTVRQILGVRIPEVQGIDSVRDKAEIARKEANNFVSFTNNLLKDQRKKKFIQINQVESIRRIEWPRGHKGLELGWDRRLHVTLKPGSDQTVFEMIQAQNFMCAKRNREIAAGEASESDRLHRHLQIQLTELQRKEQVKLQAWCHRTNAQNRELDKECKLWFVFFREDGTPFRKLIVDRHPQRLAELEHHWAKYRTNGSRFSRRQRQAADSSADRPNPPAHTREAHDGTLPSGDQGFRKVVPKKKKTRNYPLTADDFALLQQARAHRSGYLEDIPVGFPLSGPTPPAGATGYGPPPQIPILPPPPPLGPTPTDSTNSKDVTTDSEVKISGDDLASSAENSTPSPSL